MTIRSWYFNSDTIISKKSEKSAMSKMPTWLRRVDWARQTVLFLRWFIGTISSAVIAVLVQRLLSEPEPSVIQPLRSDPSINGTEDFEGLEEYVVTGIREIQIVDPIVGPIIFCSIIVIACAWPVLVQLVRGNTN